MTSTTTIDVTASEPWFARLRDRFAAADPAFSRFRLASRAILSLLVSGTLVAGLSFLHGLPAAAYGLAIMIPFTASTAIRDKGVNAQMRTRIYAFGSAVAATLAASIFAPIPIAADLVFLIVIFIAVYIRRFGQRWTAVGMIGFMSYFLGDYLRPVPQDIGWLALAAALGLLATHIVSSLFLRDDPERDFRRALSTIDRRINLILRQLIEAVRHGVPSADDRKLLREHQARLRGTVLMAEGFIPQGEAGSLAAAGPASDLAIILFELQLCVERTVQASYIAPPQEDLLRAMLHHEEAVRDAALLRLPEASKSEPVAARLLIRVHRARARLDAALASTPSPAFAPVEAAAAPAAIAPPKQEATASRVPVAWQLPIQVTLACALAMGSGLLLSTERFYWAVITAFIVFNNTKSRADTALRALQRSGGSFAGLIGGTIVATLLHGQLPVSVVTALLSLFLAIYFLQTSYSLMIFFITIALAVLYGVMGTFSPELLFLRLEETVVGALAGTLVAFLVFPARASRGAAMALETYLRALGDLVATARRRAHGEQEPLHLLGRSRALDRAYVDLANAVRPLGGPWGVVTRFGGVRERLLLLAGCAHWARVLARSLRPGEAHPQEILLHIDKLVEDVKARIARVDAIKETFFERAETDGAAPAAAPQPLAAITENEDPVFSLGVIAVLLERATPEGVTRQG
ncbi:FUSC family protein [Roseiarcaceae bacterium H3SJ34-1]|uniref:FUSC family protein n=1 Tax=Terripilifer ovatus TaxID=3032367 RepID=UPI003AB99B94|nr:FUSC family protein [Roseiarcaceae bacterium H3SJ34-1]